jgi:hypothetical protein
MKMQLIRRFPLFLGWFSHFVVAYSLILLIALPFRGKDFKDLSALTGFILLLFAVFLLIGFLAFVISLKYVAIPAQASRHVKLSTYLLKWFDYLFSWIVFCVPLACWSAIALPLPKLVSFLWQLLASYLAYRLVVNRWRSEIMNDNQHENQDRISAA